MWEAGQPHGIFALGAGAFNSLRVEKGYRAVGADLTTDYNPYEAGLGWAVRLKKGDFLGREALLTTSRKRASTRTLCCLTSDDPAAMALGKEPVFADAKSHRLPDQRGLRLQRSASWSATPICRLILPIRTPN